MKIWKDKSGYFNKNVARQMSVKDREHIERVLVIRQCAFGDYIAARPFFVELRKLFPRARITLASTTKYCYSLPDDLVDDVFIHDTTLGLTKQYRSLSSLGHFDILFDLADTARSRALSLLADADLKMGFPYRSIYNYWLYDVALPRSNYHYEAEVLLDFLKVFGSTPTYPLDFALPTHRSEQALPQILYFPFASNTRKAVPAEAWQALLIRAVQIYPDHRHLVLEGRGAGEKIGFLEREVARYPNLHIQKQLPLDQLSELMASASLLVCGDTGVRNLALATHTPSVGIFYSTLPYRYWPRYDDKHSCVFNPDGQLPSTPAILSAIAESMRKHHRVYPASSSSSQRMQPCATAGQYKTTAVVEE